MFYEIMIVELNYFILMSEEKGHTKAIFMFPKMTLSWFINKSTVKNSKKKKIEIHL